MNRRELLVGLVGRCAGWTAVGAGAAWGAARLRPRAEAAGPVHLWAADRARHRVVALDAHALVGLEVEVPAPVALAAAPEGGVWIASSLEGGPAGAHALLRIDARGRVVDRRRAGRVRALAGGAPGLFGCEGADDLRTGGVVRWPRRAGLAPVDLAACDARAAACDSDAVWWLEGAGRVGRWTPSAEPARFVDPPLDCVVQDVGLAAAPRGAYGAWSGVDGGRRVTWLAGLDAARGGEVPRVRWLRRLDDVDGACLAADGRGGVWSVAVEGAQRFDRWGTRIARSAALPTEAVDRAVSASAGGVWVAAGGALLRLDGRGRPLPGQGRFGWLVDLCPAAPPGRQRAAPDTRRAS